MDILFRLLHEAEEEELHTTPLQVGLVVFCIISLLIVVTVAFEAAQEHLIENCNKQLRPMITSLFGEMTILGFLSVITFIIGEGGVLQTISKKVFNDTEEGEEKVTELFEQVHYLLFGVMVLFITQVLILLHMAKGTVNKWRTANRQCQNDADVEEWRRVYIEERKHRLWGSDMIFYSQTEAGDFLSFLSMRKEFIEYRSPIPPYQMAEPEKQLPVHFDYAEYLSVSLGLFLADVVNLPPSTWIGLWFVSVLFFVMYISVDGDNSLFTLLLVIFGFLNLIAITQLQKKNHYILSMLVNPNDFPLDGNVSRSSNATATGMEPLKPIGDAEEGKLQAPLVNANDRTYPTMPGWTQLKQPKPYKSSAFTRFLVGEDVVPNKHNSLFWFGKPGSSVFLIRLHLLVRSIYISLILGVIFPELVNEYNPVWTVLFLLVSLGFVFWEYMFVLHDLITTTCHITCAGALRHIPTQEEVLRKQKTKGAIRAIMMMTSLVQSSKDADAEDSLAHEDVDIDLEISQDEMNAVGAIFDMYDSDGSGEIDKEELAMVMSSLGFCVDEKELDTMFAMLDVDGDGTVSRTEFIRWHIKSNKKQTMDMDALVLQMFRMFDTDNSGSIKVSELVEGLNGLKHGLSTDDIVALAQELDANGDGEISLEEFKAIIKQ